MKIYVAKYLVKYLLFTKGYSQNSKLETLRVVRWFQRHTCQRKVMMFGIQGRQVDSCIELDNFENFPIMTIIRGY